MTQNILLTSLDTLESESPLRYYGAEKEFGCEFCEALQDMEASSKYILAHYRIDEIIVIGEESAADKGKAIPLQDADALYTSEPKTLSAFDRYRARLSQHIDEVSLEQQAYDALLPEEERTKIAGFIRSFQEEHAKRLNRLFSELACDRALYEQFKDAFFDTFPEMRKNSRLYMKWVKNYLYEQLKLTAKLEILPVNENVCVRYIPASMMEKRECWVNGILDINQDVLDGKDEINLYVSFSSNSVVDGQLVLNLLDILVATPGSNVHLKKIYKVYEAPGSLTGRIEDYTASFRFSDLVTAAHAFLNYSKTDMLVDFWESSGEHNERISSLIYAARHVDVGISMCNMREVQEGIQRLRRLLKDESSWTGAGEFGLLFGVIAGSIQADYSALLEGEGDIPFIELIKWAYRHQLYQQVLTLIESHAPSNLVRSGIFYYCDDEAQAPAVTNLLALQRLELKSYETYKLDDIDHYFVKYYDRAGVRLSGAKGEDRNLAYAVTRAQSIESSDPEKIKGHTVCNSIETVQNVLYAYFHLGEVRNKISHADANAMADRRLIVSESDVSYAMMWMRESIEYFILSYEKAMQEVQGKNPKIVAVSPEDVRNAAERIKRESYPEHPRERSRKR